MLKGKIVAVCISQRKGTSKKNVTECELEVGKGLVNDAHSGPGHRQVSLLAIESIDRFRKQFPDLAVDFGSFAENLTTEGIELKSLPIGTLLNIGESVQLKVTQIGKECHTKCAIYHKVGNCIMPLEGVFAEVVKGGKVKTGDEIKSA
ncbi:MAG: MOSC domain-containing protein [Planctomycetota bacterium]